MNIVAVIICYLIGSINFAYLVAKYKKINIQEIGSGNPGSSNVLRALGRNYAIVVFSKKNYTFPMMYIDVTAIIKIILENLN